MPKYFCDYCDTYLTHDSPSVRKTHNGGRKHKENVRLYYQQWMEEQAQKLVDATAKAFQEGKIPANPAMFAGLRPPMGAMIPPPPHLGVGGMPRPGMPGMPGLPPMGMGMGMGMTMAPARPGYPPMPMMMAGAGLAAMPPGLARPTIPVTR